MKVSVIIPIRNTDKYLRRYIDSVLDQDFNDYVILLIDDGSKDNYGIKHSMANTITIRA